MTTTISIRVAGKPSAGQGGDGTGGHNGRFGLRAKLAAGVMILGCAAALAFGVLRTEDTAQLQPQPTSPAPFACQAGQSLAGTDDCSTSACIGTAGLFACAQGQSTAGTDDFAPPGCVQVPGPFACANVLPAVTEGTDDLATSWCIGTEGPFACPPTDRPSVPNER